MLREIKKLKDNDFFLFRKLFKDIKNNFVSCFEKF